MLEMLFPILIALGVGGLVLVMISALQERAARKRVDIVSGRRQREEGKGGLLARIMDDGNERRRILEEKLREMQEKERKEKKRVPLRQRLQQAGLQTTERQFYLLALVLGAGFGLAGLLFGSLFFPYEQALLLAFVTFLIGLVGVPLLLLRTLIRRRQEKFLKLLPDAVELIVRGLRSGLPIAEALKTIANEIPDPVGPEFREVVEGQKIGISIDQGFERMYERVPLPEVNFLAIVVGIQRETGGNLSEALDNLSAVLRSRKTMKLKVKALSQEAKAGAAIIGSLPILMMAAIATFNPDYLKPLFNTQLGHIMLVGAVVWMATGVLVMRKMINFRF